MDIDFDVVRHLGSKIFIEDQINTFGLNVECDLDLDVLVWNTVKVTSLVSFSQNFMLDEDTLNRVKNADFFEWKSIWPSSRRSYNYRNSKKDTQMINQDEKYAFEYHCLVSFDARFPATLFGYN